jgi:CubicO group peptidase (beta-lactamase class C family)
MESQLGLRFQRCDEFLRQDRMTVTKRQIVRVLWLLGMVAAASGLSLPISCSKGVEMDRGIEDRHQRVADYLQRLQLAGEFPGLQYVVFDSDGIVDSHAVGLADVGARRAMTTRTRMNVFSTTKVVTAVSLLQLQERGLLRLGDDARRYLDYLPYPGITLRQIASHGAGLPNPVLGNFFVHWQEEHASFDRNELLRRVVARNSRLRFSPGQRAAYSNLGYALLGQVIEKVSGRSYEQYAQANVFAPLGLSPEDIHFGTQDYDVDARPYFRRSQLLFQILARFVLKGAKLRRQDAWVGLDNRFYLNAPAHGGIITSAESFAVVLRELLRADSRLLGQKARALLFTEQVRSGRTAFALAWSIGELDGRHFFGHRGGGLGYVAEVRLYPDSGLGSILMINMTTPSQRAAADVLDVEYLRLPAPA